MNIVLFDDDRRDQFYPLSLTRPISQFRLGIQTIAEKWERISNYKTSSLVPDYLSVLYPRMDSSDTYFINSRLIADSELWGAISTLSQESALMDQNRYLAFRLSNGNPFQKPEPPLKSQILYLKGYSWITHPEDLIRLNAEQIESDYIALSKNRESYPISSTNRVMGNRLFVNGPIQAEFVTLNTQTGPIFIDEGVQLMEGVMIRGPFAVLNSSVVKMGAKIYGGTTLGPHCTLGGEIKNSILMGNSNKGHEGYMGDSIIGEWCNLGADTNNSNLKNNYKTVKIFDYSSNEPRETHQQFLGMIMGDYVKCGINSTINTGTVMGIGVNWFGPSLSPNFIPDFTWAESGKFQEHKLDKMIETTSRAMQRRNHHLSKEEIDIIKQVFEMTKPYREY